MSVESARLRAPRRAVYGLFALGLATAAVAVGLLAECYLRCFPPRDILAYLGDASPLTGAYAPDADFAFTYRSWTDFSNENAERLQAYEPIASQMSDRKLWAFFGNSFIQAPGMLGDAAKAALPDRTIFYLGKNEPFPLRFAQINLLLENGLRPERIFFELMTVDVLGVGEHPLATHRISPQGALTYELPTFAAPIDWLVRETRIGLTACVRTGWQRGNPHFRAGSALFRKVDEPLLSDLRTLFGNLARATRDHRAPVTVILIPSYYQICRGASYGFQDQLAAMLRREGFDVFDPRDAFHAQTDKPSLFIPDKHFSARGNRILLAELLKHVEGQSTLRIASAPGAAP